MLGLLFIYWIGKYFYELAQKFNKSKWGFAILGLVAYYGSQLIIGFVLGLLNEIFELGIDFENNIGLNLLGIPVGGLCCYFLYNYLEKKWKKEFVNPLAEIEAIGTLNE